MKTLYGQLIAWVQSSEKNNIVGDLNLEVSVSSIKVKGVEAQLGQE